jgi:hypothetical protein
MHVSYKLREFRSPRHFVLAFLFADILDLIMQCLLKGNRPFLPSVKEIYRNIKEIRYRRDYLAFRIFPVFPLLYCLRAHAEVRGKLFLCDVPFFPQGLKIGGKIVYTLLSRFTVFVVLSHVLSFP